MFKSMLFISAIGMLTSYAAGADCTVTIKPQDATLKVVFGDAPEAALDVSGKTYSFSNVADFGVNDGKAAWVSFQAYIQGSGSSSVHLDTFTDSSTVRASSTDGSTVSTEAAVGGTKVSVTVACK